MPKTADLSGSFQQQCCDVRMDQALSHYPAELISTPIQEFVSFAGPGTFDLTDDGIAAGTEVAGWPRRAAVIGAMCRAMGMGKACYAHTIALT
jgi:hypothetical protein